MYHTRRKALTHQIDPFHDDAILFSDYGLNDPDLTRMVPVHDVYLVSSQDLAKTNGNRGGGMRVGGGGG